MGYLQCSYPRTLFRIASSRRYAQIPARKHILAHICAIKQSRTKSFSMNIGTILKNMPTNFELKRLKPKLDIVKKPENRVHELTDSNVSPLLSPNGPLYTGHQKKEDKSNSNLFWLYNNNKILYLNTRSMLKSTIGVCWHSIKPLS